jgi:hypothetical protein
MIVYVPLWLEFSYLALFEKKKICFGDYEQDLWSLEEEERVFIKHMNKNYEQYESSSLITVIFNTPKNEATEITTKYLVEKLCEKFNYSYSSKIVIYCEKYEKCPFIAILTLKLGGSLMVPEPKELIPLSNTISTSKYLQSSLWFYFLNKRNNNIFGFYSEEKCLYFFYTFMDLEEDFGYIHEDLAHIFLMPLLYFNEKNS